MKQRTLAAQSGFERYTKKTRRAIFLEEMEQVVPWAELSALIEPVYPKVGQGRPPVGVERMLRIYFLQQWFNLSDPGVEEALYDSGALRGFVDIDLGREPVPDETTVCKFRHLLEEHKLGARIFERVQQHLQERGLRMGRGTIVDATIVHAPSSTKNREQKRDPEMHQTRKGKQWSLTTLAVGIFMIVLLVAMERLSPKAPAPLIAVAAGIAGAYFLNLGAHGVELVGHIPQGLPSFTPPVLSLAARLWPGALGIALMSFTETIAAGRAFVRSDEPSLHFNLEIAVAKYLGAAAGAS